eukprot:44832-Lingulodinium_polyedra.AAC.1
MRESEGVQGGERPREGVGLQAEAQEAEGVPWASSPGLRRAAHAQRRAAAAGSSRSGRPIQPSPSQGPGR